MKKQILLVEDNSEFAEMLELYLCHLGYETIVAKTSGEGLAKALCTDPAIIILDLALPDVSGIDLAVILKQDPNTSHIPIMVFTALADNSWRTAAQEVGVSEFLCKPCSLDVLRLAIERLIGFDEFLSAP